MLLSNPCFEIWLLLHAKDQKAAIETDALIKELKKSAPVWKNYSKSAFTDTQKAFLNAVQSFIFPLVISLDLSSKISLSYFVSFGRNLTTLYLGASSDNRSLTPIWRGDVLDLSALFWNQMQDRTPICKMVENETEKTAYPPCLR